MNDFEQHLKDKFPDLFHKNEKGELYVPCGCYCPEGWETLVEDLLQSINGYVKHSTKSEKDNIWFYRIYKAVWIPIYNFIYRLVNPAKVPIKERFFKRKSPTIVWKQRTKEELAAEKLKLGYKLQEKLRQLDTWIKGKRYEYKSVPIPAVKIEQIKEKFGGLRVYISGGDAHVGGKISFAESLSFKTCMFTGGRGERYNKRGWIVTASKEKMEEFENEK